MRWVLFVLLATIYVGGIVGSFEFFGLGLDARFSKISTQRLAARVSGSTRLRGPFIWDVSLPGGLTRTKTIVRKNPPFGRAKMDHESPPAQTHSGASNPGLRRLRSALSVRSSERLFLLGRNPGRRSITRSMSQEEAGGRRRNWRGLSKRNCNELLALR